jgi:sialate O-acetylesterase
MSGEAQAQQQSLRLPKVFADHMVLQRDTRVPVWGWAAPGATVSVTLAAQTARARADTLGAWASSLPAMRAGGPYDMSVESNGTRIAIRDVLVGDVWVASGQSNMEFTVSVAKDAAKEIAAANDPQIRHFKVPNSWAESPADDVVGGSWERADPQRVGQFSAVAYYFARDLRTSIGVPIGILNATWGGSNIETWISRTGHGMSERELAAVMDAEHSYNRTLRDSLTARLGTLPTTDGGLVDGRALWADPALDESTWTPIQVPAYWEHAGYEGMDGVAWYRTSFVLSGDEATRGARLSLGPIDDDDITWVNGVEVGRTEGYLIQRAYALPPAALRAGRNVLAIRVSDGGGGGGINGDPTQVSLDVGGVRRPLAGTWKFRVGQVAMQPDGQHINKIPTILYNQMLHPLQRVPVKGVIWYQGESNANNDQQAAEYRPLFEKLITSWRREWSGADSAFPFLWAQLPNYGRPDSTPPARAAWATQRESMSAALKLPNTGQAITIDVGEADNLHPLDKQDVGRRLALVARKVAYGQSVVSSGPTYRRHTVRDGRLYVEFANLGGGLASRAPDGAVGGFAIAGTDRKLVWAQARIEGDRVVVWSDQVREPIAVRYAWSNSPAMATLYNRAGLPAAPFRTDAW